MALRRGDALPTAIRRGDALVARVYRGDTKVWEAVTFSPLRMDKSGTFTAPANSTSKVTGWAPNATSPYTTTAADIVDNELVVNGDGAVTVSVQVTRSTTNYQDQVAIFRNGVQVAISNQQNFEYTRSVSWSGIVAKGDKLSARYRNSSAFQTANVTAGYLGYTLT